MQPRLVCWYGDAGADYRYSGASNFAQAWTEELLTIKARVEALCSHSFNAVLGNCYRDGQDSVGWHSDDEPELGVNPTIASLSLGAARRFQFKHKHNINLRASGSLLSAGLFGAADGRKIFSQRQVSHT